jgi:hypothetical protein
MQQVESGFKRIEGLAWEMIHVFHYLPLLTLHFPRERKAAFSAVGHSLDLFRDEAGNGLSSPTFVDDSLPIEKNPEPFEKPEKLVML